MALSVAPSTIFSFVKVRAKRRRLYALPPSDDPPVVPTVPVNPKAREFFSPPEPNPMKTNEDPTTSEISAPACRADPNTRQSRKIHRGHRALRMDEPTRCFVERLRSRRLQPYLEHYLSRERCLCGTWPGTGRRTHQDLSKPCPERGDRIDPSAHMNRTILRAMEMVRLTQLCEAIAARITVLIYPVDEVSDMDDISQTVEALGDSVDWVIIRNPVKIPTTKFFQGSELESPVARVWSRAAGNPGSAFRHPQSSALAGNPAWTGPLAGRGTEESANSTGHGTSHRPRAMAGRALRAA